MKVAAFIVVVLLLGGCNQATINAYCQLAKPISWSKKDTKPTVRQIVAHNRVWISQNCKP